MKKEQKEIGIKYNIVKNWPKDGINFIDLTPTLLDADSFSFVLTEMLDKVYLKMMKHHISSLNIDYIVCPESRGFIWGTAMALKMHKPMIYIRKKGKLPKDNIGSTVKYDLEYGTDTLQIPKIDLKNKRCIFIDDIYATGGTYKAVCDLVEKQGGFVEYGVVIYNISKDESINVYPAFKEVN